MILYVYLYHLHRADFGGMDVYVKQILGSNNHDLFYTDSNVKVRCKYFLQDLNTQRYLLPERVQELHQNLCGTICE